MPISVSETPDKKIFMTQFANYSIHTCDLVVGFIARARSIATFVLGALDVFAQVAAAAVVLVALGRAARQLPTHVRQLFAQAVRLVLHCHSLHSSHYKHIKMWIPRVVVDRIFYVMYVLTFLQLPHSVLKLCVRIVILVLG
jgi:hypothetical protein